MLGRKHDTTEIVTLEAAQNLYNFGIAVVVTDGKYIQLGEEERRGETCEQEF
jgi:hypothetical protein